jgi:hypothetical protein
VLEPELSERPIGILAIGASSTRRGLAGGGASFRQVSPVKHSFSVPRSELYSVAGALGLVTLTAWFSLSFGTELVWLAASTRLAGLVSGNGLASPFCTTGAEPLSRW